MYINRTTEDTNIWIEDPTLLRSRVDVRNCSVEAVKPVIRIRDAQQKESDSRVVLV